MNKKRVFKISLNNGTYKEVSGKEFRLEKYPDVVFFTHESSLNSKLYAISEERTGRLLVNGEKTIKAAKAKLDESINNFENSEHVNETFIDYLNSQRSLGDEIKRYEETQEKIEEFKQIFKFPMPRCYLSYLISGRNVLDVVKLDGILKVPDGISTRDYIKNNYGSRALELVEFLMKI